MSRHLRYTSKGSQVKQIPSRNSLLHVKKLLTDAETIKLDAKLQSAKSISPSVSAAKRLRLIRHAPPGDHGTDCMTHPVHATRGSFLSRELCLGDTPFVLRVAVLTSNHSAVYYCLPSKQPVNMAHCQKPSR